jgi:hypothetical protein
LVRGPIEDKRVLERLMALLRPGTRRYLRMQAVWALIRICQPSDLAAMIASESDDTIALCALSMLQAKNTAAQSCLIALLDPPSGKAAPIAAEYVARIADKRRANESQTKLLGDPRTPAPLKPLIREILERKD